MKKKRTLAAIMFTDIAGYTALMQENEALAAGVRTRHRKIFQELHEKFNGEIIQYFGDGTLSIFRSAVEATNCAVELQKSLRSGEPVVSIRIGVHLGDIVYSKSDIYGDGVNLASRIENLSPPGSVLLSEKVNDELKNHHHLVTKPLGTFNFKNVIDPVQVYCIVDNEIIVPDKSELAVTPNEPMKSIAVLPMVNMSSNPENEYFSDGMTEEIINALSKVKGLKVTSRTSSFYFKNKNLPTPTIGKELNVSTILEGSVRLAGNKIRITVQLIDCQEDSHFWSETFDRSIDDIFTVQDEVSLIIAEKLRDHLGDIEIQEQLVVDPQVPVDTYKEYLKSRFHMRKMTRPEIEKGMKILRGIVSSQPSYPYGHLGMHMGFALLGSLGFMPAVQAFIEGKRYLDKALELDSSLPECQLQLSWIYFLEHWDLAGAYQCLANVYENRPIVDYYQSMASIIVAEGKFEEALDYIEKAAEIDPMSEINYHLRGFILYSQEKYEEAMEQFNKCLEILPDSAVSDNEIGQSLILLDRKDEALEYFDKLDDKSDKLTKLAGITLANAALRNSKETTEGIKKLTLALETEYNYRAFFLLVYTHVMIEDYDEALSLLEKGVQLRLPLMVYIGIEPFLKPIRSSERFKNIVEQVLGDKSRAS